MLTIPTTIETMRAEIDHLFASSRAPKRRTMRQFAEQEIVISTGRYKGRRWRADRQPYVALLMGELERRRWPRIVNLGCTQSGKTLTGFILPILYHLFEMQEDVIAGFPDMDMARDKWEKDLLPAIMHSRYRDEVPVAGSGSRGGKFDAITFRNGATLKLMSGGGSDKSRAGFTARVLVVTEVDGLDSAGEGSREADKITQLEARTLSYGSQKQIYLECTVSIPTGRTWSEYQASSRSRIATPCPHCGEYVTLEREQFVGWEDAADLIAASELGRFACSACGEFWTDEQRTAANQSAVLLHGEQTISKEGVITGDIPRTDTLGVRWSAVNNLFWDQGMIAAGEWKAARAKDKENAKKERQQFFWAVPYSPPIEELHPLTAEAIPHRILTGYRRGLFPQLGRQFVVGTDINSRRVDYVCLAALEGERPHLLEYGTLPVVTTDTEQRPLYSLEQALLNTITQLFDRCEEGWEWEGQTARRNPDQVWIDSGWMSEVVYRACEIANQKHGQTTRSGRYRPIKGYGSGQDRASSYRPPRNLSSQVLRIDEHFHFSQQPTGVVLVEIDSDYWKSHVHARLSAPLAELSAAPLTLFDTSASFGEATLSHEEIAQEFCAEIQISEYIEGKGNVTRWKRLRKANHKLDCTAIASAAAHFCGARLPLAGSEPAAPVPSQTPTPAPAPHFSTPDGRPFFIGARDG